MHIKGNSIDSLSLRWFTPELYRSTFLKKPYIKYFKQATRKIGLLVVGLDFTLLILILGNTKLLKIKSY